MFGVGFHRTKLPGCSPPIAHSRSKIDHGCRRIRYPRASEPSIIELQALLRIVPCKDKETTAMAQDSDEAKERDRAFLEKRARKTVLN